MSEATDGAGASGPRAGDRARWIVLDVAAVTGWSEGGENRKPGLIVKVKVRPSGGGAGQAAAALGTSCRPGRGGRVGIAEERLAGGVLELLFPGLVGRAWRCGGRR